jgi:hypothetical protein
MNSKHITKGLLFGASLLLATAAFAGEKATVRVYENVKVNGTTLAPGKYEVAWEGTGATVQVSIRQGSNTIATIPAAVETAKAAPAGTGYSTKTAGKKVSLNLDQQAVASAQSAGNQGNK